MFVFTTASIDLGSLWRYTENQIGSAGHKILQLFIDLFIFVAICLGSVATEIFLLDAYISIRYHGQSCVLSGVPGYSPISGANFIKNEVYAFIFDFKFSSYVDCSR